jgi:hypothetical protein
MINLRRIVCESVLRNVYGTERTTAVAESMFGVVTTIQALAQALLSHGAWSG